MFFLSLTLQPLQGQNVLLSEDFDGVSPPVLPTGWLAENLSGTGTTWVTYGVFAHSPPNCAAVFGDWQPKDEWLISPAVEMEAGTSYRLSFHYRTSFSPQKLRVMMGSEASADSMESLLYMNQLVNNTTYQEGFAIITPEEDLLVHFGWHVYDSQNNGSIYLDDILLVEMEAVPHISLSPAAHHFGTISVNESAQATLQLANLGGAPLQITSTVVQPPFYADYSDILLPGDSATVEVIFEPDTAGAYSESLVFEIEGDFTGSNTVALSGHAYAALGGFFEDFEASTDLPPGWSAIIESASGSANVSIYQAGEFFNHAYSGVHAARLYNGTLDDILMLVTPELSGLQEGQLGFWTKVAVFPEPLIIGTLSDSDDHESFVPVDTITSQAEYMHHTYSFPDAPSDHVYIAFKHGTSSLLRPLFIDDVSWEEAAGDLYPPQNLVAENAEGGGLIHLGWEAPHSGTPMAYNIYRNQELIHSQEASHTEYGDHDIEHGISYTYHVTAVYTHGESEPSNEVTLTGDMGYRLIHASAGDNGSIQPEGTIVLDYGDDQAFEVTADEGHHIDSLVVDGQFIAAIQGLPHYTYLFENVTDHHEIHAIFAANIYELRYHAGDGGSLEGDSIQQVAHGQGGTPVEAVADSDHHFMEWSDGITDNPRTDTHVTGDLEVWAMFESSVGIHGEPGQEIRLFPNPATDKLWLVVNGPVPSGESLTYRILDTGGQTLLSGRLSHGGGSATGQRHVIPVRDLSPGIYLLEVSHPKGRLATFRVTKH